MLVIVISVVVSLVVGWLSKDLYNNFEEYCEEERIKEKYEFESKVRTICRELVDSAESRVLHEHRELVDFLGYEGTNYKVNKDGSRCIAPFHYVKKKKK